MNLRKTKIVQTIAAVAWFLPLSLITYASVTAQEVAKARKEPKSWMVFLPVSEQVIISTLAAGSASCDFDPYWHLRRGWLVAIL